MSDLCPCSQQSSLTYQQCCAPIISGQKKAQTAEQLMRARYSAFVKKEVEFIINSHHPETRDQVNKDELKAWSEHSTWLGLSIQNTSQGTEKDQQGEVEFTCHYRIEDKKLEHHELASFKKSNGEWFFYDGKILHGQLRRAEPKVGRNDPCSCGSGKKYKKCHG